MRDYTKQSIQKPFPPRAGYVAAVPDQPKPRRGKAEATTGPLCYRCGYHFPPGSETCLVCGFVWRHRGEPYPAASVERYDWARAQHIGDPAAKELLGALVAHDRGRNETPGTVRPSIVRLALMVERSEATVYRKLAYLEKQGWLVRQHDAQANGWRAANRYTITSPFHRPTSHAANPNLSICDPKGILVKGKSS